MNRDDKFRMQELKVRDQKIIASLKECQENIKAMERLIVSEQCKSIDLLNTRATYETELLNLQADFDFENDSKSEKKSK